MRSRSRIALGVVGVIAALFGDVRAQGQPAAATLTLASDITSLVALDNSSVAVGLADGQVAIWNGRDATASRSLAPHKARVLAVGVSADGRRLLSVASDGALAETPLAKGAAGRTVRVELGAAPTRVATFSPDGTRLIAGGEFGDVRVFDVESGRLRHTLRGHRTEIQDLAVRPGSMTVVSAGADADLRLWDGITGRQTGRVDSDLSLFAVAFSPRDGTLASGGPDRRVTLRDAKALAPVELLVLSAPKMVATLAWSPDGRLLAVGDIDDATLSRGGLRVIDTATRAVVATLATGDAPAGRVAFFGSGDRLAAVIGREVRAWTLSTTR